MKSIIRSTLIYAIIGPPIGALFAVLILVFGTFVMGTGSQQDIVDLPMLLMLGVTYSFVLGGVQAAFVGAVVGFFASRFSSKKIVVPIAASIVSCLFFLVIVFHAPWSHGLNPPWSSPNFIDFLWRMLFFLSFHVLPAGCVWCIEGFWLGELSL